MEDLTFNTFLEKNAWRNCVVTAEIEGENDDHCLMPRSFHVSVIYKNYLIVCGGEEDDDEISIEVINLGIYIHILLLGSIPS